MHSNTQKFEKAVNEHIENGSKHARDENATSEMKKKKKNLWLRNLKMKKIPLFIWFLDKYLKQDEKKRIILINFLWSAAARKHFCVDFDCVDILYTID